MATTKSTLRKTCKLLLLVSDLHELYMSFQMNKNGLLLKGKKKKERKKPPPTTTTKNTVGALSGTE